MTTSPTANRTVPPPVGAPASNISALGLLPRRHRCGLTAADVTAAGIQPATRLRPSPAPARSTVVGRRAAGLAAGHLLAAACSQAGVTDAQTDTAVPRTVAVEVANQDEPQATGSVRVDGAVAPGDAPALAAMATAGRIIQTLTGRG
jgi:hypothetical protein